jgi:hypothetical protein
MPSLPGNQARPLGRGSIAKEPRGFMIASSSNNAGERMRHEKQGAWSFHQIEGWKLIDSPLDESLSLLEALPKANYSTEPGFVFSWGPVTVDVYESLTTATHLAVIVTPGTVQILLLKSFPSLMDMLHGWLPVFAATGLAWAEKEARDRAASQEGQK